MNRVHALMDAGAGWEPDALAGWTIRSAGGGSLVLAGASPCGGRSERVRRAGVRICSPSNRTATAALQPSSLLRRKVPAVLGPYIHQPLPAQLSACSFEAAGSECSPPRAQSPNPTRWRWSSAHPITRILLRAPITHSLPSAQLTPGRLIKQSHYRHHSTVTPCTC